MNYVVFLRDPVGGLRDYVHAPDRQSAIHVASMRYPQGCVLDAISSHDMLRIGRECRRWRPIPEDQLDHYADVRGEPTEIVDAD